MVVPRALLADEREVKFLVQRRNGDVEAEDLVREAVGKGNGVGGGLEQLGSFLFRVFLDAGKRLRMLVPARLTWIVISPFSTVSVPLPSQASLAWNMELSVLKSAV